MFTFKAYDFLVFAIGFFAQFIYGVRVFTQWKQTERRRQSSSSPSFWLFSLIASTLFILYGVLRHDLVIVLGQLIVYPIYLRNMQLISNWQSGIKWIACVVYVLPVLIILYIAKSITSEYAQENWSENGALFFLGMAGQLMMNSRFVYQIYITERRGISLLPKGFWLMSIAGSILLLLYAIGKTDPVLFIAQGLSLFPYARNLRFIRDTRNA